MRRIILWSLALLPATTSTLFAGGGGEPPRRSPTTTRASAPESETIITSREAFEKAHEAEKKTYLQRVAACDKMRVIAVETGDTGLEEKALKLEQLAFEVYRERTARLQEKWNERGMNTVTADRAERAEQRTERSAAPTITGRAANGRPIISREDNR